jgi:hypothetical protein
MSSRTKIKLRPAPVGAETDSDAAFAHSIAELDAFCRRQRRRYGKWAPLVRWAAEQKTFRDNAEKE